MKLAGEFSTLCWDLQGCESFFSTISLAMTKKNPVSHEILIQVASISILGFCFFKVIRLKQNILSALGPPNTEESCSVSCLSAWPLPKLLESYFPLDLIILTLEINCSGASIWQLESPDLEGIVRVGSCKELFHFLPKFVPPLPPYSVFLFK